MNLVGTLMMKCFKLHYVKSHWILILNLLKWVLGEYKLFVVKMHIDAAKSKHV